MTTRRELAPRYDAAAVEPRDLRALDGRQMHSAGARATTGRGAVRRHPAATERDRCAPPRPRAARDGRGHLRSATTACVATTRCGSRASTTPASRPSSSSTGSSPRRARPAHRSAANATSSGCGSSWTRRATSSANQHRRLGASARLEPAALHDGRRQRTRRPRRLQAPLGRRPRLSRRGARQLVPALPDDDQRPGEHPPRGDRGTLWTIRYHLERPDGTPDPDAWISVATTRPETLLGDTAVAVHPDDDRYRDLVGRTPILPFLAAGGCRSSPTSRSIATFGTGAVKITPAHDPRRLRARQAARACRRSTSSTRRRASTRAGGPFAGMDRFEARAAILERLREMGDLEAERDARRWSSATASGAAPSSSLASRVQWFIRVESPGRASAGIGQGRADAHPAVALREGVRPLDGEHP